jgi:hypothetical protein
MDRPSADRIALLGSDSDEVIAAKIKRTASAVRQKRTALRIATFQEWHSGERS